MATRQKRGTSSGNPPANSPTPMHVEKFVREMAARNTVILKTALAAIQRGEISIVDDARTERYIEDIVSDWCEDQEPSLESHMTLCAAVFFWALLDEVAECSPEESSGVRKRRNEPGDVSTRELALEALRTIRSIWGRV